jgi:hypothetical protein
MTTINQPVTHADYSDPRGVTLTLACSHKVWVAGFPRAQPIPSCFRFACQQSPCYRPDRYMGD